jgi:hypothetical protein
MNSSEILGFARSVSPTTTSISTITNKYDNNHKYLFSKTIFGNKTKENAVGVRSSR